MYCWAFIFFLGCSKDEGVVEVPLSSENYILNFELPINGELIQGDIIDASKKIMFNTQNAELANLTPHITISSKSKISPSESSVQDFSSPIFYTVTAENGEERNYEVIVNDETVILTDENKLLSFKLNINGEEIIGLIDEEEKTVTFNVAGADLNNLTPTFEISEHATVNPGPGEAQNFNEIVSYTILASNGSPAVYRVIINNRPLSTKNNITFFSVRNGDTVSEAKIDEQSGIIWFDFGDLDRSHLTTEITIPEYATISPEIGDIQDFSNPVTYEVTAENGEKKEYRVIANFPRVERIGAFSNPAKFFVGATFNIQGAFMDADAPDAQIYLYDGSNKFPIEILETTNYENGLMRVFNVRGSIPELTPTNENYKVVYEANGIEVVSEFTVDIKQENAPLPLSVDKNQYGYNDELVMLGENLTTYIAIPAPNGSTYLMDPRGSQIQVNEEKTELRVVLDIRQLFPSYYLDPERETTIYILDAERRTGRTIKANFY